mmetsp:Transcript_16111/g.24067  ORF Transcript_16111/g.24067 Transcript_16111/m.24067 type:complete len:113 (+) Transcript_16111:1516-1854(+)
MSVTCQFLGRTFALKALMTCRCACPPPIKTILLRLGSASATASSLVIFVEYENRDEAWCLFDNCNPRVLLAVGVGVAVVVVTITELGKAKAAPKYEMSCLVWTRKCRQTIVM